jgi:hypothetical protein
VRSFLQRHAALSAQQTTGVFHGPRLYGAKPFKAAIMAFAQMLYILIAINVFSVNKLYGGNMAYSKENTFAASTKTLPTVSRQNGAVENGRLVYHSWVKLFEHETGEPSSFTHPRDDRQCRWNISGHMQRQYFAKTMYGPEDPQPAETVTVNLTLAGTSNGLLSWLDHDPCSDFQGQISEGVNAMKAKIAAAFDQRVAEDLAEFKAQRAAAGITVEVAAG